MVPSCQLCEVRLSKGTMASASTSVWEKPVPSVLALMPDSEVKLLPQWGNIDGVSLSKSLWGPFKRNVGSLEALSLLQPKSSLAFTARSYGAFSSWHWNPELGGLMWGCNPSLFTGDLRNQDISPNFTSGCGVRLFCASLPLLLASM